MPVIPELGRWGKDLEFKISLDCRVSYQAA